MLLNMSQHLNDGDGNYDPIKLVRHNDGQQESLTQPLGNPRLGDWGAGLDKMIKYMTAG